MPTDTSIVYVPRAEFDAVCARYHLTPEPVYSEGFIEARFRFRRFHGHLTEVPPLIYRTPLNDEEKANA